MVRPRGPVVDGGQTTARELSVCGGFVPTDAYDGIVTLSLRIFALDPIFGSGTAGCIAELSHRLFPTQFLAVANKVKLPVLRFLIPPGINKCFVLAIRDFVLIDPIVGKVKFGHTLKTRNE